MGFLVQKSGALSVDELLPFVGEFGKFQKLLVAFYCLAIIPTTFQILIMYFAALDSPWQCTPNSTVCTVNGTFTSSDKHFYEARCSMNRSDWQFTESIDFSIVTKFDIYCENYWLKHMTTSIMFVGWIFGAIVLGWVADNYGRRKVLFPSIAALFLGGFVSSFSPNIWFFIFMRFCMGFAIPGTQLQMFTMASEMVGPRYRPLAGIILWLFFAIGLCVMGLKAYFIREWKILYIVCTIPYIFLLLFFKFVPESIRWLNVHGKTIEGMEVLYRTARWNGKVIPSDVTLKPVTHEVTSHKSSPRDLFRTSKMAVRTAIQGYSWFVMGMVYYGLSLAADDLPGNLYINYVLFSLVEFPAVVLAIYLCHCMGRKKTVVGPMFLGSMACILVAFIPSRDHWKVMRVCLGILGKFSVTLAFDSIYTWSVEIYPTNIRAEGMGFLQVTSRMGAASAPWVAKALKKLHETAPFVTMGGLALAASIFLIWLPETRGKATAEVDGDKELETVCESELYLVD